MTAIPPTAFLVGERLYLRPVEEGDLPHVMALANDEELRGLTGGVQPMSHADALDWLERVRKDPARLWFVIVLRDSGHVIGEAGLLRIFHEWRTADMSLMLGDRSAWGQGYGTEAARLLVDHAFGALSLHRLAIGVVGFNERALAFWESLGFRREGIQREGYFHGGRFHDFVMMARLASDPRPGPTA